MIAVLFAFVFLVLPGMLSTYWTDVATAVVIYSIVALGLGLLMGRVGLVSLGQVAVLALGAWVGGAAAVRHRPALPDRAAHDRADHDGARHADRACPRCASAGSTWR